MTDPLMDSETEAALLLSAAARVEELEAEVQRLRKVEVAARGVIDNWGTHPALPGLMVTPTVQWDALRTALSPIPVHPAPVSPKEEP